MTSFIYKRSEDRDKSPSSPKQAIFILEQLRVWYWARKPVLDKSVNQ